MNIIYYTNFIEGLPNRFRHRNTQVNLYQPIEIEDYPLRRRSPLTSDDNSGFQEFSPGTEVFYSGEEDLEDQNANLSSQANM